MKENYLFRENPLPPAPGTKPVHGMAMTMGILALVVSLYSPLVAVVLAIIGRVSGENNAQTHNIRGSKICCNVAFVLAGLQFLLTIIRIMSQIALET